MTISPRSICSQVSKHLPSVSILFIQCTWMKRFPLFIASCAPTVSLGSSRTPQAVALPWPSHWGVALLLSYSWLLPKEIFTASNHVFLTFHRTLHSRTNDPWQGFNFQTNTILYTHTKALVQPGGMSWRSGEQLHSWELESGLSARKGHCLEGGRCCFSYTSRNDSENWALSNLV